MGSCGGLGRQFLILPLGVAGVAVGVGGGYCGVALGKLPFNLTQRPRNVKVAARKEAVWLIRHSNNTK